MPRLGCFHNGIILIVICFRIYTAKIVFFPLPSYKNKINFAPITHKSIQHGENSRFRFRPEQYRLGVGD
jgi:hypothetical protein